MITVDVRSKSGSLMRFDVDTVAAATTLAKMVVASPDCDGAILYEGEHRVRQLYRDSHENTGVMWEYVTTCDGRTLALQTTFDVANATSEALTI
jgi:hypothetical protein